MQEHTSMRLTTQRQIILEELLKDDLALSGEEIGRAYV